MAADLLLFFLTQSAYSLGLWASGAGEEVCVHVRGCGSALICFI